MNYAFFKMDFPSIFSGTVIKGVSFPIHQLTLLIYSDWFMVLLYNVRRTSKMPKRCRIYNCTNHTVISFSIFSDSKHNI